MRVLGVTIRIPEMARRHASVERQHEPPTTVQAHQVAPPNLFRMTCARKHAPVRGWSTKHARETTLQSRRNTLRDKPARGDRACARECHGFQSQRERAMGSRLRPQMVLTDSRWNKMASSRLSLAGCMSDFEVWRVVRSTRQDASAKMIPMVAGVAHEPFELPRWRRPTLGRTGRQTTYPAPGRQSHARRTRGATPTRLVVELARHEHLADRCGTCGRREDGGVIPVLARVRRRVLLSHGLQARLRRGSSRARRDRTLNFRAETN